MTYSVRDDAGLERDPDACRKRRIDYWAKYGACPIDYCKALPKMMCRKRTPWATERIMMWRAHDSRPLLKKKEEA